MKKIVLISCLLYLATTARSQTDTTMKTFVDSVCKCLSRLDMNNIKDKGDAQIALTGCILNENMGLLMQVAEKRGVSVSDKAAMEKVGQEMAMELMKQNCNAFVQMSLKMSQGMVRDEAVPDVSSTSGTLTSVETKDFCKFIVTDTKGKKVSFYWLHYFKNSEKFTDQPSKYVGKKLKIFWQETEVYVPTAKGYYKIKEITEVQVM